MAKFYDQLTPKLMAFIERQHLFFTASSTPQSRINLSPKGMDTFRVIRPQQVAYLDVTGSGNETAAHLKHDGRLTFMFCSFEAEPLILATPKSSNVCRSLPACSLLTMMLRGVTSR